MNALVGRRVARGAELLDHAHPLWFQKVDPNTLDMFSPEKCALAQVYGSYAKGLRALERFDPADFSTWDNVYYGFTSGFFRVTWGKLDVAWRQEINQRLAAQGAEQIALAA